MVFLSSSVLDIITSESFDLQFGGQTFKKAFSIIATNYVKDLDITKQDDYFQVTFDHF